MTFAPPNAIQSYVPTTFIYPETPEETRVVLTDYLKKIVAALNAKDIGQYNTQELVNGQVFFTSGNNNVFRNVYRKVIDFGSLPNAATKSVAHNITFTSTLIFTRIYGAANDSAAGAGVSYGIPLPYANPTALNANIELYVTTTDVVVVTAIDYSRFEQCYIILEYIY